MAKETINEREFELINIISVKIAANQRDLSRHMDLSLGLVNMLLRRLITKGYIRINQLNKKKVQYILTPKGFKEKMRKSVKYTLKTIDSIGKIREQLKDVLSNLVAQGKRDFVILGESDFALLVEVVLKDLCQENYTIEHMQEIPSTKIKGTLLICKETDKITTYVNKENSINLVEELAKEYVNSQR